MVIDHRLEKKRRRLLAEETGTIYKQGAGYAVALAYPNVYSVGMGNLGFQSVYGYLNGLEGVSCERAFLPDHDDLALFEKHDTHLFTLESGRPVAAFDLVAFSISFEDDILNLPRLFRLLRLPILSQARNDRHPLVLGGGMCAFMNPEPLAPLMDFLFLGEAEAGLSDVMQTLRAVKSKDGGRNEALDALRNVPGVYVPRNYHVIYDERSWVTERRPLDGAPAVIPKRRAEMLKGFVTKSVVYTRNSDFGAMHLVEVTRGCGWRCRFCAEGYTYLPPRTYDADAILGTLPNGAGPRKVGLVGTSLPEHPRLLELLRGAALDQRTVCTASLRLDGANRDVLARMSEGAQKTLTIAPEAGNERMRRVINKPISDAALSRSVETAMDCGIKHIKLYFIVGLPFEEEEDVLDIVRLSEHAWDLVQARSRHPDSKLTLSVNPFIPKPSTPFQWSGLKPESELKRKVTLIKEGMAGIERVHVSGYSPRQAVLQSLLSIGDRRVGEAIAAAGEGQGLAGRPLRSAPGTTYGIDMGSSRRHWATEFPHKDWIVHRDKDVGERLPWEFIDHGVRKSFLVDEYRRAEAEVRTRACHVPTCRICGVCRDEVITPTALPATEYHGGQA